MSKDCEGVNVDGVNVDGVIRKGEPMDDLISRQAAIEALENTKEVAR